MRDACRAALWALTALGAACDKPEPVENTVESFMECDECVAGELAAVRDRGDVATPLLTQYLVSGPPADRIAEKRSSLLEWQARVYHDSSTTLSPGAEDFLENYTLRYQSRAATALKAIDTKRSRAALCAAGSTRC